MNNNNVVTSSSNNIEFFNDAINELESVMEEISNVS